MNKRSLNRSSYFFYYCKGSNSCGSSCSINGCSGSCSGTCHNICAFTNCEDYCSMSCGNGCTRNNSNNCYGSVCYVGCGGHCGGNCEADECQLNCLSSGCYSSCNNWCFGICKDSNTVESSPCGSSSCSATGRNIFYYATLNISLKLLGVIIWVEKEKFLKNQKV